MTNRQLAKQLKEVEARVMHKIKARMKELAKDPKLKKQMEKEFNDQL